MAKGFSTSIEYTPHRNADHEISRAVIDHKQKIYITRHNSDFTEGRGPMVHDKIFLHRADAEEYIDRQSGIMGRQAKWSKEKYGDWDIVEALIYINPHTKKDQIDEDRLKILAKLTDHERQILGV